MRFHVVTMGAIAISSARSTCSTLPRASAVRGPGTLQHQHRHVQGIGFDEMAPPAQVADIVARIELAGMSSPSAPARAAAAEQRRGSITKPRSERKLSVGESGVAAAKLSQVPGVRVSCLNQRRSALGGQQNAACISSRSRTPTPLNSMLGAAVRTKSATSGSRTSRRSQSRTPTGGSPRSADLVARSQHQRSRRLYSLRRAGSRICAEQPVPGHPAGRAGVKGSAALSKLYVVGASAGARRAADSAEHGDEDQRMPVHSASYRTAAVSHDLVQPQAGFALGDAVTGSRPRRRDAALDDRDQLQGTAGLGIHCAARRGSPDGDRGDHVVRVLYESFAPLTVSRPASRGASARC